MHAVFGRVPEIRAFARIRAPDRETFIARFQRGGRQYAGSVMPWEAFARMIAEDLGAISEFLHTLPPADGPAGDPAVRKNQTFKIVAWHRDQIIRVVE